MFKPSTTIFRNPETNNLFNPSGKKAGKEIVSLGKTNQQFLRKWANEKYKKEYKVITQFQKEFKLKNPTDTYNYLKTQYNNELRNRITEQKQTDKDSKNTQITELKQKAKEQKKSLFIQEVTIEFLKRQKDSLEPYIKAKYSTTAYANKKNKLDENIKYAIKVGTTQLQQDSPTEIIITKVVLGKLYSNEDIVSINRIRMRDEEALLLDGMEKPEWDTGNGKCVYDAIISSYNRTKGLIKKMTYEYLTSVFLRHYEDNDNPLENGVTIEQVIGLCEELNISCYAFDIRDNCIQKRLYNNHQGSKQYTAFVFRLWNNHIYPITDEVKRKSLITLQREKLTIMNIIQKEEKEEDEKFYNVIAPTEDINGNDYATKYIFDNGKVPFPFTSNKIKYDNGNILSFKIGDDLILTDKIDESVKEYIEKKRGGLYQGETAMGLLYELWEEHYGETFNNNDLQSTLSPTIYDILTGENIKYRTHYGNCSDYETEFIKEQIELGNIVGADIKKCYSSILDNPMSSWLKYELYDEVEQYIGGDIEPGLYRVETNDFSLFHGTNWYSHTIILHAKQEGIDFIIKEQLIPQKQNIYNTDYFKTFIDYLIVEIGYDTKQKQNLVKNILNAITGLLGRNLNTHFDTNLTTDINEVWNGIGTDMNKINKLFLKSIEYNEKTLHIWGIRKDNELLTNNLPNYIQILDQSNIKIYELQKRLGGELIFRKTDCVICYKNNRSFEDTDGSRKNWGTYKMETKHSLLGYDYEYKMNKNRNVKEYHYKGFTQYSHDDTIYETSSNYKQILDFAVEKGGLLICARAGTGKSYLINKWVEEGLIEDDERTRLAFTNRARRNIKGTTIHTAFAINDDNKCNLKMLNSYRNKKVIMIDEIGMIGFELWKHIVLLKKKFPDIVFILMGDYRQLPPIEDLKNDYFESEIIKYLCNYNRIELLERQRYDLDMWNWLEDFYEKGIVGKGIKYGRFRWNAKNLVYYNKTRDYVNDLYMAKYKTPDAFLLKHERKNKDDKAKDIWIYKDMPIMSVKNSKKYNLINSDELIVTDYNDEFIYLKNLDNDEILEIPHGEFHKIFVCNYATTIHKIQGATITENINIWNSTKVLNDKHLGYTAVSRAKKLEQIIFVSDF